MAESGTSLGADSECGAMLELATPDLYRLNAFRILGLPIDVSSGDLSRRQRKMKMLEKLGDDAAPRQAVILPLEPAPDSDAIRKANQRLHDPESRLVHEVFWFWPLDHQCSDDDRGLTLMRQADLRGAHALWSQLARDGQHKDVATHNLAVLHHAVVLDMERELRGEERPDEKSAARRDKHWQVALDHWAAVAKDEAAWDRVVGRIEELRRDWNDPRFKVDVASRLRRTLPVVLLTISIRLAISSAKRGDVDGARKHLARAHIAGFDESLAAAILDREAAPLVEQIKQMCEPVPGKCKADAVHADTIAQQLMIDTGPLLASICALLDNKHHLRGTACDAVAQAIRDCTIDYGNSTGGWERCVGLLKQAVSIALHDGLRDRLRADIAQVEKNLQQEREYESLKIQVVGNKVYEVGVSGERISVPRVCACCLGPADAEQSVSYSWEENAGYNRRIKHTRSFAFPLCNECRGHQRELTWQRAVLVLLSVGLSVIASFVIGVNINRIEYVPFLLIGIVLSAVAFGVLACLVKVHVLKDTHAARGPAVAMTGVMGPLAVFSFHNPLYADAFAKSNASSSTPKTASKYSRGRSLLRGKAAVQVIGAAVVLAAVGHSIVFGIMDDRWGHAATGSPRGDDYSSPYKYPSDSPRTPPSNGYSPPRTDPPRYSLSVLSTQIDAGKARAKSMEPEIERMDSNLESLSSRINRYKQEIEGYERQARLGLDVNQSLYLQALDNHNALVKQHNALLLEREGKYAEYSREIDSVNDRVRRYNSGER